jgi:peroxiredoxin
MPALARVHANVKGADFGPEVEVKFENRKQKWPLLRVLSLPSSDQVQTLTQLAMNPETLDIARMVYSTVLRADKVKVQMTLDFTSFQIGPVPDSAFIFDPPKGAKLVDAVPIPGQTGSFLLNQPAPDFELKTLDGEKVRLADLRGRPVLLSFWASWCGPCRRELPQLSALLQEYKDKGLVVLGINDEDKGKARKYAGEAGLVFQTLDDSSSKVHRLYRVRSIPTVFLIDRNGKIVLFLRGAKEPAKLRASLSSVGL